MTLSGSGAQYNDNTEHLIFSYVLTPLWGSRTIQTRPTEITGQGLCMLQTGTISCILAKWSVLLASQQYVVQTDYSTDLSCCHISQAADSHVHREENTKVKCEYKGMELIN